MNDHQVLAAVALLVVLALAIGLALRALRRIDDLRAKTIELEAQLAASQAALSGVESVVAAAGVQNTELARRIEQVAEQQEQLRLRDEDSGGYRLAIRLAREGADADRLVQDCGLNRGEAELLVSLHRGTKPGGGEPG